MSADLARPRVSGAAIDRGWLADRLRREEPLAPIAGDQGHEQPWRDPAVPAAVLLGLVAHAQGPTILLTQRTAHLRDHAGQISFPGGRIEPGDRGPTEAALREASEEIGLDPACVTILGDLDLYRTITGFIIHPVVGWIDPPVALAADPHEVAEVFEVPLAFVLDAANHRRDSYERDGQRRHFYVLPYQDRYIWGATAGILVNFARRLVTAG